MLRRRLDELGVAARVHSAGLLHDGEVAPRHNVDVLAGLGFDIGGHRSRRMTQVMLRQADLVIGMARHHVLEAAALVPEVWQRAFTLKELVRRAEAVGPRGARPLSDWLREVGAGRRPAQLFGQSDADDVFDPIGGSRKVYERTAAEIDALVGRLCELAFAPAAFRFGTAG